MGGNARVPAVEITGLFGALVKRMSRKMLGEVPEEKPVCCGTTPPCCPQQGVWTRRRRVRCRGGASQTSSLPWSAR